MTNRILTILAVIGITLLALIAALVFAVSSYLPRNQSIAAETEPDSVAEVENKPTLASPVAPTIVTTISIEQSNTQPTPVTTEITAPAIEETTGNPNQETQCGETGSFSLLLIVEDSNNGETSSGAQMIRMLQADFNRHKLLVVPFSAYMEIGAPALEQGYGIQQSSLGSVYHSVQQAVAGLSGGHSDASRAVEQIIFDDFGISADHYLSLNERFFMQLSQWIGPIQIENPGSFSTHLFEYPRGPTILTDANIWDYLVYSEGTVDEYFRLMRQDIVLNSVFESIQAKFSPQEFEAWLASLAEPIVTDLPFSDLASSMCLFYGSNDDDVQFTELPYDIFELTLEKMIVTDLNQARSYLQDLFAPIP